MKEVEMTSVSSASSSNAAYLAMQKNLFSKSDSDSSGGLSEEEFVAARPKGVSETQATALYATLDSENTGSLTEDQFSSAMSKVFSGDDSPESRISSEAMDVLMQL
jgi:Ca2+-binding EF-hand superfamily protein